MKRTVNFYDFHRAFIDMRRKDQFSTEGLKLLFEHLEQYEDETGTELELDVIALCCEYAEEPIKDVAESYSIDISDCEDDDEIAEVVYDYLNEHSMVCGVTSDWTIVYLQF